MKSPETPLEAKNSLNPVSSAANSGKSRVSPRATGVQRLPLSRWATNLRSWLHFPDIDIVVACNEVDEQTAIAAINEALGGDQEWVRIAPYREMPNSVGLQVFDRRAADAMVSAFNSLPERAARLFRGLPVYVGHPDDQGWSRANPSIRAEAVGRIKELQPRDDGLYGRVAWNDEGKRLISGDAAAYAYHSPRWSMRAIPGRAKTFRPELLHSIGLTNHPNIPDLPIGLNEAERAKSIAMKKSILALLAALGRPAIAVDATDAQFETALNAAAPVATSAVADQGKLGPAQTSLTEATNEANTLKTERDGLKTKVTDLTTAVNTERAARADGILVGAVNTGRISEADKPAWKTKLTADGADITAINTEMQALKPALNTGKPDLGGRKGEANVQGGIIAINEAIAKHRKEHDCDHHTAYCAVKRTQPALFTAAA